MSGPVTGRVLTVAGLTVSVSILAACAVGPDFKRPVLPDTAQLGAEKVPATLTAVDVHGGEAQTFVTGQDVPGGWWTAFHAPRIDALVEQALMANPDIDAARAALRQARENTAAEEGTFLPPLEASGSATRQRQSSASFGQPGQAFLYSLFNASVSVSYVPDVFGGTRRQVEALDAQADYQRFELEATYLSLSTNVVTAAINAASLKAQIAATQYIAQVERDELNVLNQQFELGAVAKSAVAAQQTALAQSEAALPPLDKQLSQVENQLAAYTGRFPGQAESETLNLTDLTLPAELPVSLPSELVDHRPDLRAAEAQLHAASADVGVAISNMLPQFTLTGSYGGAATAIGALTSPANLVWSIGAGVTQPVIEEYTLLHRTRAARAAFDQAAAQYRGTALKAFQDVANTLRALQFDAAAVQADLTASRAAGENLDLAKVQYQAGAITYLALLDAERSAQQALVSLVQAQASRFADSAALFQALGGGWWHRDDSGEHPAGTGS